MKQWHFFFLITLLPFSLFSLDIPEGSEGIYSGYTVSGVLAGYTEISDDPLSIHANPAFCSLNRWQTGVALSGIGSSSSFLLFGGLPTPLGSIGAGFSFFLGEPSINQFTILWSRAISRWFSVGVQATGGLVNNQFFGSLDIGMLQRGDKNTGIGFNNWNYGIVLKNIGTAASLPTGTPWKPFGIGLGGGFSPVVLPPYEMHLQSDLTMSLAPFSLIWGVGMKHTLFDAISVVGGYQIPFGSFGVPAGNTLSLGTGSRFGFAIDRKNQNFLLRFGKSPSTEYSEIELWYGMQFGSHLSHHIMLIVNWGHYDDKPPVIQPLPPLAFSPNVDGSKDEAIIPLPVFDNDKLSRWEVEIVDEKNQVVRRFESWIPLESRTLSPQLIFQRITSPDKGVDVPESISWDGKNEQGKLLPDGVYRYRIRARDLNNNETTSPWQTITLDTYKRAIALPKPLFIFSPNGDGRNDTLILPLSNIQTLPQDRIILTISDSKNTIIYQSIITNTGEAPSTLTWDGSTNSTPIPEGNYTITLTIESDSGNTAQTQSSLRLVRSTETLSLSPQRESFSAIRGDALTITTAVSSQEFLTNWKLSFWDSNQRLVRVIQGTNTLPPTLTWDGKDNNGTMVPDGTYTYQLTLFYESGNQPQSEPKTVRIDNTPPRAVAKLPYTIFSPLPDSRQKTLPLFLESINAQTNDTLTITIAEENGNIILFDQRPLFEWNFPFEWTGLDSRLNPLPEGRYRISLRLEDETGNFYETNISPITLRTGRERISVTTPQAYVSPTLTPLVPFQIEGNPSGIKNLEFTIRDSNNNIIYQLTTNQWIATVQWDITKTKDGSYTYQAKALYEDGQNPASTPRRIERDAVAPSLLLTLDSQAFSPNNDGRKDTLTGKISTTGEPLDSFQIAIISKNGETIRTWDWKGVSLSNFLWNGKNNRGQDVPEGEYAIKLFAIDPASNTTVRWISNIFLARSYPTLEFEVNDTVVTPNSPLIVKGSISETNRIESNELAFLNQQGDIIHRFSAPFWTNLWVWKGESGQTNALDGYYTLQWTVAYSDGNLIQAELEDIILDTTPPKVNLFFSPTVFTPDNDGENDTMDIRLNLWDLAGIASYSIEIYKIRENKDPLLIKKWQKTLSNTPSALDEIISWDGRGEDNELVESIQDYRLIITATDNVGHTTSYPTNFTTGILVEKTPDGLRIRMSSIRFALNSASLIGPSKSYLDQVVKIFQRLMSNPKRYGLDQNFVIEVSGHTDDLPGPTPDFNQKLSEKRALAVYQYLISRGIPAEKLSWTGYGSTRPYKIITPTMTREEKDEYRSRNRRVEFFIRKSR